MSGPVPLAEATLPIRRPRLGATAQERLAYRLILPVLGVVFVVVLIPFLVALTSSLRADGEGGFVGGENYGRALSNPLLYDALRATGLYALIVPPAGILLGAA